MFLGLDRPFRFPCSFYQFILGDRNNHHRFIRGLPSILALIKLATKSFLCRKLVRVRMGKTQEKKEKRNEWQGNWPTLVGGHGKGGRAKSRTRSARRNRTNMAVRFIFFGSASADNPSKSRTVTKTARIGRTPARSRKISFKVN